MPITKEHNIHKRIYNYIVRVLNLMKSLPKTPQNLIIINQISRSATSMGANDQEADGAMTRKDFIHCYTVVRKEGKETSYWLKLISDTNPSFMNRMESLMQEGEEIVKIVSTIVFNSKKGAK